MTFGGANLNYIDSRLKNAKLLNKVNGLSASILDKH